MISWLSGEGSSSGTSQASGSTRPKVEARKVNDSLYELCKPSGTPKMEILFFHGLQSGDLSDAHLRTWESEDGQSLWPQTLLGEDFPMARMLCVSYHGSVAKSLGTSLDMHNIVENLISDFAQGNVGQTPNCPVVLIGHSFGGLVIKNVCVQANNQMVVGLARTKLENFLRNVKGVFYYGTPHLGSPSINLATKLPESPLLSYFTTLSKEAVRLVSEFEKVRNMYAPWQVGGLAGNLPDASGIFKGVVVAPEESARTGDHFNILGADHLSICKPRGRTDRRYYALTGLLSTIAQNVEAVVPIHECHGLPKHPIELETRALHLREKLRNGGTLGIFGMGGIGKTTVAKQAFNIMSKDFEYTCFVDNVKGIPLHGLVKWILDGFHENGKKMDCASWSVLKARKCLIAMDDIDCEDQLKVLPDLTHFGAGSCVMVTSRDKDAFKVCEDGIVYDVDFLEIDDAKKLFRQHAFGQEDIPDILAEKVNQVVKKCGGLPLTLEVIGTYLRGKTGKVWDEALNRLTKAKPITGGKNDRVWESLQISYYALQQEEQEMFTEAALFFFEQPLDEALTAWSSLTQNTQTTWENLVSRSLVKEMDKKYGQTVWVYESGLLVRKMPKTVWVHEHLRDLARRISKGITISGSDAMNLLNEKKANASAKGLKLQYSDDCQISALEFDSLANLERLKYVELDGVPCQGQGKGVTRQIYLLKVLASRFSKFEFSLTKMANLAVLHLSNLEILKEFPEALGNLINLQILRLSGLKGLDHLPENFGSLERLRELILAHFSSLILPNSFGNLLALENLTLSHIESLQLPESFGDLSSLVKLRLDGCKTSGGLPDSFGANLTSLKELEIRRCPWIKYLPESVGDVSSLVTLSIRGCKELAGLPDSFGGSLRSLEELSIYDCPLIKCLPERFSQLPRLKELWIRNCSGLEELGEEFGKLSSLRQLSLRDVALTRLPDSFSLLSALETLTIDRVGGLRSLPENFGDLVALQDLSIEADELQTLPDSFSALKSLRKLEIKCSKLEWLPSKIGNLCALEELEIVAPSLESLPDSIGHLRNLRKLMVRNAKTLNSLPEKLGELVALQDLSIDANELQTLPDSFSALKSLRKLDIRSSKLEGLPSKIGNLSALEELEIVAPSLESLPESIGHLRNLRKLTVKNAHTPDIFRDLVALQDLSIEANELQTLPDSLFALKLLRKLEIKCSKLEGLPSKIGNLSALEELEIVAPSLESLPDSIGHLRNLRKLMVRNAKTLNSLPEKLGELVALKDLSIEADELQTLPDSFSALKSLRKLEIKCSKLEWLPSKIGNLSALEELKIVAASLESLPDSIGHLRNLRKLKVRNAKTLKSLPENFGDLVALQDLSIEANELQTLPDSLFALKLLRKLEIRSAKLEGLPSKIGTLSALEELVIVAPSLESLPDSIGHLRNLRKLTVGEAQTLKSLPENFGDLVALQDLSIEADEMQTLPDSFSALKSLRKLEIKCSKLEGLPSKIGTLSALEELEMVAPSWEFLPDSIGHLRNLRKLMVGKAETLKRLPENFGDLVALQDLSIEADELETLPDSFPELKSLKRLSMGCPKLDRLPGNFGNLSSLEEISITSARLERLPESIGQLRFLKKLTLNAGTLLHGIGQIRSLEELELRCDGHEERSDLFAHIANFSHKLTLHAGYGRRLPTGLGRLTSLKHLRLYRLNSLERLPDDLGTLASLEILTIRECHMLESLPDSLGHLSSLKKVRLYWCKSLKSLPESWQQPSLSLKELPRRDHMEELREPQAEESLQTKKTEGALRLIISECPLLNDSVLKSFGWMRVSRLDAGDTEYLRKALVESSDHR